MCPSPIKLVVNQLINLKAYFTITVALKKYTDITDYK